MRSPSRRNLLKAVALTPAVALVPVAAVQVGRVAQASAPAYAQPPEVFLTPAERSFVDAAVARIIPADELGPGAREAGVASFIDHQLAGPYGRAERRSMQGPWAHCEHEPGTRCGSRRPRMPRSPT